MCLRCALIISFSPFITGRFLGLLQGSEVITHYRWPLHAPECFWWLLLMLKDQEWTLSYKPHCQKTLYEQHLYGLNHVLLNIWSEESPNMKDSPDKLDWSIWPNSLKLKYFFLFVYGNVISQLKKTKELMGQGSPKPAWQVAPRAGTKYKKPTKKWW